MANKYIIQGATYNGDGTASNEAASAGAAGAWNHIDIYTGTAVGYGSLNAGDVVNIRTKTSAGADITITTGSAVTLGVSAATELSPILWNFDNGVIWSGISGQVTVDCTAQAIITVRGYNNIEANDNRLKLKNSYVNHANLTTISFERVHTSGVFVDISSHTGSYGGTVNVQTGTHTNIYVKKTSCYVAIFRTENSQTSVTLINPKIELLVPPSSYYGAIFFADGNYQGSFTVFGGECFGAGTVDSQPIARVEGNSSTICLYGFKYPRNMPLSNGTPNSAYVVSTGADGAVGSSYFDYWFTSDSRSDGYYPTLNALLETSGSGGWSYKVYPYAVTKQKPARVSMSKLYTQAADNKTIALSFLWPQSMAAPTKDNVYLVVGYTDNTTGNKTYLSSKTAAATAVSSSTAAWSAVTYGATLFNKHEISIATTGDIKQDTEISVSLLIAVRSASTTEIMFIDPDFTLT